MATLNNLGFEANVQKRDSIRTITSRNCPVLRVARAHREVVCRGLHAEIIRAAAGVPIVQRGKWIVDGDPVCTHTIPEVRSGLTRSKPSSTARIEKRGSPLRNPASPPQDHADHEDRGRNKSAE